MTIISDTASIPKHPVMEMKLSHKCTIYFQSKVNLNGTFRIVFDVHIENSFNSYVPVLIYFINRMVLIVISINNSRFLHTWFDDKIFLSHTSKTQFLLI